MSLPNKVLFKKNGKNYYKNQDGSVKIKENSKNTSNYRIENLNPPNDFCPICLKDIINQNDIAVSINPCGHVFHKKCIQKSFERINNKCPICQRVYNNPENLKNILGRPEPKKEVTINLSEHTDIVTGVAFIDYLSRIVSASLDKTIRIWELNDNTGIWECIHILNNDNSVKCIAVNFYGTFIVAGLTDGKICGWRLKDDIWVKEFTLHKHNGSVNSIIITLNSYSIISCSDDGKICVYHLIEDFLKWEGSLFAAHLGKINSIALSPDEKSIVSGSDDGTLCIWNALNGKRIEKTTIHKSAVISVYWTNSLNSNSNVNFILSGSKNGIIFIYNPNTGYTKKIRSDDEDIKSIMWITRDSFVVVYSNKVSIFENGRIIKNLDNNDNNTNSVAINFKNKQIIFGSNNDIKIWNYNINQRGGEKKKSEVVQRLPLKINKDKSFKQKQKKHIGGKFYGEGSSGAIFGLPRAPYSEKYDFSVTLDIKENKTQNKTPTFNFNPKNNNKENQETIEVLIQDKNMLNQVSKFFFRDISFLYEANRYINILKHIFNNLSKEDIDKYFNLPLNLGIINKDLMCNPNYNSIYNKTWLGISDKNQTNNKTFKQILDSSSPYQITFFMGESLLNISLELFYQKYINVLESLKLLNNNDIIFDDFKLDNLIFVNDSIKQSDFSSILKFNQITLDSLPHTILRQYFYESYNPLLMMLLKYYLYQRENKPKTVEEIYQEAFKFRESTKNFVKEFDKNVIDRIKLLIKNNVNLELELNFVDDIYEIKEINNSILKSELRMSIKEILMNLIYNRQMNTKNTIKILSNLVFYFDKKYKSTNKNNTINNIINNILQRINIYSTGYIIFDFLSEKIDRDEIKTEKDIDILYNLLLISFTCCNQIFIGINNIHIQELNIDTLLQTYNKFLNHTNSNTEKNNSSKKRERNANRNAKNIVFKTKLHKAHSI
jgi:WD40 repeat protein